MIGLSGAVVNLEDLWGFGSLSIYGDCGTVNLTLFDVSTAYSSDL